MGTSSRTTWIGQRMPNALVEALRARAKREGVSVTAIVIAAVQLDQSAYEERSGNSAVG
jgi:hypothetical protein